MKFRQLIPLLLLLCISSAVNAQYIGEDTEYASRPNVFSLSNYSFFPTITYERAFPLSNNFGLIPAFGAAFWMDDGLFVGSVVAVSAYGGNNKHKGELGLAYVDIELPLVFANYRFTSHKGFFGKLGFAVVPEEEGIPMLGFGYAF